MKYVDLHAKLKELLNYEDDEIIIDDNVIVRNFDFDSKSRDILPGGAYNHGICKQKNEKFEKILAIKILLQF